MTPELAKIFMRGEKTDISSLGNLVAHDEPGKNGNPGMGHRILLDTGIVMFVPPAMLGCMAFTSPLDDRVWYNGREIALKEEGDEEG